MARARIGSIITTLRAWARLGDLRRGRLRGVRLLPATLRGRIACAGALLAAVGILSLTVLQVRNTRQTVLSMLESQQQTLARRGAAEVGGKLGISFGILRALSKAIPREQPDDPVALQAFLESRRMLMDMFQSVGLIAPDGRMLAYVPVAYGARRASIGDREQLRQALAAGRPAVSAPVVSHANGQTIVTLTMPVKDLQGRPVAALGAALDLMRPNLLASLARQPIGTDGFFMVVTRDGVVVSHRDAELVGTRLARMPGAADVYAPGLSGRPSLRYGTPVSGERSLFVFEPVPNSDWMVVAVRPERELVAPLAQVAGDEFARGAFAALLVGTGLWLVLYWLLQPLEQLKLDLVRMRAQPGWAGGRLSPASGAEEITSLAEEFNALSEARAQAHHALISEKNRAQVTLGSIGEAVIAIDSHGRIELLNATAQQLTGWSAAEALGRPLDDVLLLARQGAEAREAELHRRALEASGPCTLVPQAELIARDGTRVAVDDTAAPIRDEHDRTVGAVICLRDAGAARAAAAELAWKATHDPLTRLLNRAGFEQAMRDACASAAAGRRHALLLLDLDGFKAVNDRGGHDAGDELLRMVARTLQQELHEADRIARLGGDEFAVVLTDCTAQDAATAARRVCTAVAALRLAHGGALHRVQVSIGVASLAGRQPDRVAVMRAADAACFAAKRAGKNQVCEAPAEDFLADGPERSGLATA